MLLIRKSFLLERMDVLFDFKGVYKKVMHTPTSHNVLINRR